MKKILTTAFASLGLVVAAALLHESSLGYHCRMLSFGQLLFSTR